jgi:hypothetical protein
MKRRSVSKSFVAAALLLQSTAGAFQGAARGTSKEAIVLKNGREYRRLRARARAPEEFQALSEWCTSRASDSRRSQASFEEELREYYAHPPAVPFPKYPARPQTLSILIENYRKQTEHWSKLADLYSGKAKALGTALVEK